VLANGEPCGEPHPQMSPEFTSCLPFPADPDPVAESWPGAACFGEFWASSNLAMATAGDPTALSRETLGLGLICSVWGSCFRVVSVGENDRKFSLIAREG